MSMAYSSEPMNMLSYAVKVFTLRILRWEDNPELSGRVQCHHQGPDNIETGELKKKKKKSNVMMKQKGRETGRCSAADFEDGGRDHKPRNVGSL